MKKFIRPLVVIPLVLFGLVACEKTTTQPDENRQRGDVLNLEYLLTYTPAFFEALIDELELPYNLTLDHDIKAYTLEYHTLGPDGNGEVASGAILLPVGLDSLDVRSVQHGTEIKRENAGSKNPLFFGLEALLAASNGYLVVAPDYLGIGSSDILQPYLHYSTTGMTVMDMLTATYSVVADSAWPVTDRLFLSGYSGGGYATLAVHKYLEVDEPGLFTPTAVAPMAGPYDLITTAMTVLDQDDYPSPALMALVIYTYNEIYALDRLDEFFQAPYDLQVPTLLDGNLSLYEAQEQLPNNFSALIEPDFQTAFLAGEETELTDLLEANSLLDWSPQAPIRMFHGTADDVVPFASSQNTVTELKANGATEIGLVPIVGGDHLTAVFPSIILADAWFDSIRISP